MVRASFGADDQQPLWKLAAPDDPAIHDWPHEGFTPARSPSPLRPASKTRPAPTSSAGESDDRATPRTTRKPRPPSGQPAPGSLDCNGSDASKHPRQSSDLEGRDGQGRVDPDASPARRPGRATEGPPWTAWLRRTP